MIKPKRIPPKKDALKNLSEKNNQTQWWLNGLEVLNEDQWESLCDGCGLCCLHKLQDDETEEFYYTSLSCDLLNTKTCECTDYVNRFNKVPECLKLTKENYRDALPWLPSSCSYKRVANGHDLPDWHHLKVGSKALMHQHGLSVSGRVQHTKGIVEANINFTTNKARITWDEDELKLSDIILRIRSIGYNAYAYDSSIADEKATQAQRDYFGAHTFARVDKASGKMYHVEWSSKERNITKIK